MGKPKNFYDIVCITTDQQSGQKGKLIWGALRLVKRLMKKSDRRKIITPWKQSGC